MKKPVMFYCGIALSVLSFIALVQTTNPTAIGYYFGGIAAGIIMAILASRKTKVKDK